MPCYGPLLLYVALTTPEKLDGVVCRMFLIDPEPKEVDNLLCLPEVMHDLMLWSRHTLLPGVFWAVVTSVMTVYDYNPQPVIYLLVTRYFIEIFPAIQVAWKSRPQKIENMLEQMAEIPVPTGVQLFPALCWSQNGPTMNPDAEMTNWIDMLNQVNVSAKMLKNNDWPDLRILCEENVESDNENLEDE
jgi:hypothetical protein